MMAERPKNGFFRQDLRRKLENALLLVQSRMRADQVRLGLPRKKSRFADFDRRSARRARNQISPRKGELTNVR